MSAELPDTSVWIDHFRRSNRRLAGLLDRGLVFTHPLVIGELACGNLPRRSEVLADLSRLLGVEEASPEEVLAFVEGHSLMGRGLGWVDVSLLASAKLSGVPLWTLDRRLASAAGELGVAPRR